MGTKKSGKKVTPMLVAQRLLTILDEKLRSIMVGAISDLRSTLVGCSSRLAQYDVVFRISNGSQGHANVYLVNAGNNRTLIITGQIRDRSEGVRVLENDHALALALGRFWLLTRGRLSAVLGEVHHFTADMDSGELVETWRDGDVPGWRPFPSKLRCVSQIEERFQVVLPGYRGARSAGYCGESIKAEDAISLATSIGSPLKHRDTLQPRVTRLPTREPCLFHRVPGSPPHAF
jgi:hypothetical protein